MTKDYNKSKFTKQICKSSESNEYDIAEHEWVFFKQTTATTKYKCICGVNIEHKFHIRNVFNKNELIVGSVCIKKFLKNNQALIKNVEVSIYNNDKKDRAFLYRKCTTCHNKYNLHTTEDHDILLECESCNPLSHVKRFNDICDKRDIAMRKCIDCMHCYKLKNGVNNNWQVRCFKCYKEIRDRNITS